MSTLTEPTAQGLRRAVEQCAEEIHNHGELLVERNLLDIEAERKLLAGTRNPQRRLRRWPRAAGALMLLVVCYAVVARAAGAYNQSATEMRHQAQQMVDERAAEKAKADHDAYCLRNYVGEFLGGVKPDPACNPTPHP